MSPRALAALLVALGAALVLGLLVTGVDTVVGRITGDCGPVRYGLEMPGGEQYRAEVPHRC